MAEWNAPMDDLEVQRLALRDAIRHEIGHARERAARWEPQRLEIERLRALADDLASWVFCPEHGPYCGGEHCCCTDRHQPERVARHREARR